MSTDHDHSHGHEHGDSVGGGLGDLFDRYIEVLTDPAHFAVEVTFLFIELLLIGLLVPLVKRAINKRIHREHLAIDAEHGIEHGTAVPVSDDGEVLLAWGSAPSKQPEQSPRTYSA